MSLLVVGFLPHAPAGVALFLSLKIFRLEWLNVVIGGGGGGVEENHTYDSESGPMARIPRVFRRHSFPCSAFAIFVQTAHCFDIPAILSAFSSVRPNVIRGAPTGRGCWTHEERNLGLVVVKIGAFNRVLGWTRRTT